MPSRPRSWRMRSSIAAIAKIAEQPEATAPPARRACRRRRSAASTIADRLQIIAGVKALGDFADVLAQRLAVPQVQRAGERIDLRAGVVDIIFLGDPEARGLEDSGEAVADDRAAAMAHVQRPGRVRRDIFDIDPLVVADRAEAVFLAFAKDRAELVAPCVGRQPQVDEPGPGDVDRGDGRQRGELRLDQLGQRARIGAGGLGEHHRRVGREVAMRRIARRLDRHVPRSRPAGSTPSATSSSSAPSRSAAYWA